MMRHLAVLALTTTLLASSASAATYTFSFDGSINYPGTVSGLIGGLLDDGLGQAATSVTVTSVTGSAVDFSALFGFNFAAGPNVLFNTFNVVAGVIEFADFSGGQPYFDPQAICFTSEGIGCSAFLTVGQYADPLPQVTRFLNDGPSVRFARVADEPGAVPLPAGAGLLTAALALMGLLVRPRHIFRRSTIA